MKIRIFILLIISIKCILATELSLSSAYELALKNNNELKKNMFEAFASKERYNQAVALLLPNIDVEVAYNGEKYKKKNTPNKIDESFFKYGARLSQNIFRMDLWYNREQEDLKEKGNFLIYEHNKQELAKTLANAYFNVMYSKEAHNLALNYEYENKIKYEQMEKLLGLGLANKIDMLAAKVKYDEAKLQASRTKRQIDIAKISLTQIVGDTIETKDGFKTINLNFFKTINLNKFNNIKNNFEYQQSVLLANISEKEHKKRKSEYLPRVDFSIAYYHYNYIDDMRFSDEKNKIETSIRFILPIFSSGMTKSRVQEGEFLKLASIEEQKKVEKDIEIKQKKAISDYMGYIDEYEIAKKSIEHAKTYETSVERGYEEGLKDITDLLTARTKVFEAKNEALTSAYNLISSYLDLESLVGDITTDTIKYLENALEYRQVNSQE